jgi:gliding motility-associated-like protein
MHGGNVMYEYMGPGAGLSKMYKVTLLLYRDNACAGCPALIGNAKLFIVRNSDDFVLRDDFVPLTSTELVPAGQPPCIENAPYANYTLNRYSYIVDVPNSILGYTVSFQFCCRPDLNNVLPNSGGTNSLTYFGSLPPSSFLYPANWKDNSPVFSTAIPVVCANRQFAFDFSATDPDGDILSYEFVDAYQSSYEDTLDIWQVARPEPPRPPHAKTAYVSGFSGTRPLGPNVTINPVTGMISGLAPAPGRYLVSVMVYAVITPSSPVYTAHRKDFVITVAACDIPGVYFKSEGFTNCRDLTIAFENLNNSVLNTTFDWDFGDPASGAANYSTLPVATHTFSGAGDYQVKLIVNKGTSCADSGKTIARVYPGFSTGFEDGTPQCVNVPVQFNDTTKAGYGTVNFRLWDFGNPLTIRDTSSLKSPLYTYGNPGRWDVMLIVGSDKGCYDTIRKVIMILDKLRLNIGNDTTICYLDTLQLKADTTAGTPTSIVWSPNYMISDINSFNPLVSPDVTTTYYAGFSNAYGCDAKDSITIQVKTFVSLQLRSDTTICTSDPVKLDIVSDGLYYSWNPVQDLDNATLKNPVARPTQSRNYHVTASIGKCITSGDIAIKAIDYPKANAGLDSAVCLGTSAYLHASGGVYYSWSPAIFLDASNISNPVVRNPAGSVRYVVTVRDTLGCPKPVKDTIVVTVVNIKADAGPRDTVAVIGQPLQLRAAGTTNYLWTPATWLNSSSIYNPVALPENDIEYVLRASDASGCYGIDSISVKFYKLLPGLYAPNAFTPNGDGLNDVFRITSLGMKSLEIFRVYNRFGQLVYSGNDTGKGWNGNVKGIPQITGTYVWYAEGVTYLGKRVQHKGQVILIR